MSFFRFNIISLKKFIISIATRLAAFSVTKCQRNYSNTKRRELNKVFRFSEMFVAFFKTIGNATNWGSSVVNRKHKENNV
jgi:hypothetical protein